MEIHTQTRTNAARLVARLQPVMEEGTRIVPTPGKTEEQRESRDVLLTWQPSRHAKRVMRADSAEI